MSDSLAPLAGTRSPLGSTQLGEHLRIGFITHLDQHADTATIYHDNIDLIVALEELGYDSAWIATRHFHSGWAALPSPYAFLGAAAARTSKIGLGTAVLPLVLDDPVRAAEEVAVLDRLSHGRLLLGVGKGVPSDSYHVFESWNSDRDRNFEEKVDRLHWALDGSDVPGGKAAIWPVNDDVQGRVFHGSSNIETIRAAARRGDGFILERFGNGPERTPEARSAFQRRQADSVLEYRRVFAQEWGTTRTPWVVTSRTAYPGATSQAALDEVTQAAARWNSFATTVGRADTAHTPAQQLLSDNAIWGDPDALVADLLADPTVALSDELVLGIHPATHTISETIDKARTLIDEVVPALRDGWLRARAEQLSPVQASI